MAWHKPVLDELRAGRSTTVEHKGYAMFGRIGEGQLATVAPAYGKRLNLNDLVFVYCQGNYLIRLIDSVDSDRYHIADVRGKSLGWVTSDDIHGLVIAIVTPDDLLAALTVDGTETSPFNVGIHHQTRPHPGGHSFQWQIPSRLIERFHLDSFENCQSPNRDQQSHWLFWLQCVLRNWSYNLAAELQIHPTQLVDYQYVLNTIESLTVSDDRIIVEGVCSPFVRHSDGTKELM